MWCVNICVIILLSYYKDIKKVPVRTCLESSFWFHWKVGFISAYLHRPRLDCSVLCLTVHMYVCTVEQFFSTVLGCYSATVVTDNN